LQSGSDPVTHLALLRGINLGGRNKLLMQDLKALFVEAGCEQVRTFIQSGNVIFNAAPSLAAKIPGVISKRIEAAFGLRVPVILRTTGQLEDALGNNPFLKNGAAEETLHIMFLADLPNPGAVAKLDPDRSPPDAFAVRGREIYLHTPNGVGNSRLTNAWFDSRLATIGTSRNWRTSVKLSQLMQS
jgi:uncharacterized protein (DUF1697 family)